MHSQYVLTELGTPSALSGSGSGPPDREVVLAQAIRSARSGRYEEALGLLDSLSPQGASSTAGEMDLRAKIFGQLGYHLEAERYWTLAAKADPTNPLYSRALERLRRRNTPSSRLLRIGLVLAVGATPLLLVFQGMHYNEEMAALKQELATTSATSHNVTEGLARLAAEMNAGIKNGELQTGAIAEATKVSAREIQTTWTKQHEALEALQEEVQSALARIESQITGLADQVERFGEEVKSQPEVARPTSANTVPNGSLNGSVP